MTEIKNYIVLARKYRPKKLSDIIGQEETCKIIEGSIKLNRIAHAFLFSGTRGVGKTTLARILAKIVNCTNLNDKVIEPCGECKNCASIDLDNNIDVIEIDAASRTGVADVREIIDNVNYKPVVAKKKIFIIDEVHMLSKAAFNALLKTLEEPPLDVIFIFATTETEKIPLTILSRCQRFQLKRIDEEKISSFLMNISEKEGFKIEKEGCNLISEASQGSVRDALSILDNVLTRGNPVAMKTIRGVLGLSDNTLSLKLFKYLCEGDVKNSFKLFEELYEKGISIQLLSNTLMTYMYQVIKMKAGLDLKQSNSDLIINDTLKGINKNFEMDFMVRFWELFQKYVNDMNKCFDEKQCFEMIIMRLCYASIIPTPFELLKKTEGFIKKDSSNSIRDIAEEKKTESFIKKDILNPKRDIAEENKIEKFKPNQFDNTEQVSKNNLALARNTDTKNSFESSYKFKGLRKFKLLIDMIEQNSEMLISYHLRNSFRLVSLSENESFKEIELQSISDNKDSKKILWQATNLINKVTRERWMITLTTKKGYLSVKEFEEYLCRLELHEIKKNDIVKKLLEIIPLSEVVSIKDLDNLKQRKEVDHE